MKMATKDEALKMAIEALEMHVPHYIKDRGCDALIACRQALEQPKEWQGLSDDEMQSFIEVWGIGKMAIQDLEASFKEKNT